MSIQCLSDGVPPAPARPVRTSKPRAAMLAAALGILLLGSALVAQSGGDWGFRVGEGWAGGRHQREKVPAKRGGFYGCKLIYDSVRSEPSGRGWDTDYPRGIRNLMWRLGEFTMAPINRYEDGEMADGVVRGSEPEIFQCPFVMATDVGTAGFSEAEVYGLRQYLLKGGFLWVDDFWGPAAMVQWERQLQRILPEYERVVLEPDHPLMSSFYFLEELPQIPNIRFWRGSGGQTSERGFQTRMPTLSTIVDDQGRVMVAMSHNTDIGDGMEREGEDYEYFLRFSPHAYALAVNIAIYSMSR